MGKKIEITRREFLALSGATAAGAVVLSACGLPETEFLVSSPVSSPEDVGRGQENWYATTWPEATNAEGVIARVNQGRVNKLDVSVNGHHYEVEREVVSNQISVDKHKVGGTLKQESNIKIVTYSLPGRVVKINVKEGQQVKKGDLLLVIESMKMQNDITAPRDAKIAHILVKENDLTKAQEKLIDLE